MSTHKQSTGDFAGAMNEALASLPSIIDFLPSGSEACFVPVNTNENWASGYGKRALDLFVALPVLVFLTPLLVTIALLIRLDSAGPVFFRQKRNGVCGRTFAILKFRTMHVLENGTEVVQAREGDPRTTRLGRYLRRLSLDELPQLFNVLMGDMSLVGPRPHASAHDAFYGERIRDYCHRHSVKPGMTGWAQIHGLRGPTPTIEVMSRRVDFDLWYARHASLGLDLKILLSTPVEVLRQRNAC